LLERLQKFRDQWSVITDQLEGFGF
jgi:hypothetical protein